MCSMRTHTLYRRLSTFRLRLTQSRAIEGGRREGAARACREGVAIQVIREKTVRLMSMPR